MDLLLTGQTKPGL